MRDGVIVCEEGFRDWSAARISAKPCHPASPVRVLPRQLLVTLPSWLSRDRFEARLNALVAHRSLVQIIGTPLGWELCRRQACDRDELLRYSGSPSAPVLATEIGLVAPGADAAWVIALIEALLIGIVLDERGED